MQPVLNVVDIKKAEQALTLAGVSLAELMRRAGHSVAQEITDQYAPELTDEELEQKAAHTKKDQAKKEEDDKKSASPLARRRSVIVFCGRGNNGGDGWVCAEQLMRAGFNVKVITPTSLEDISSPLAQMVAKSSLASGLSYEVAPDIDSLNNLLATADIIVDAIFGTGFHGEVEPPYDLWMSAINESSATVFSVDVPSGLSAQTGEASASVIADVTVTMIALKPGLISGKGRDVSGALVVAPLATQTDDVLAESDHVAELLSLEDYAPALVTPTTDTNKYQRGTVLVIGGSRAYSGAPILSACAAARSGAGYVALAVPKTIEAVAKSHLLEIPVRGFAANEEGQFSTEGRTQLTQWAKQFNTVVLGPGLGVSADTVAVVTALLGVDVNIVLDADGLNALARMCSGRLDEYPEIVRREKALVLTPHYKELSRLAGRAEQGLHTLPEVLEAAKRLVWANGSENFCILAKGSASASVSVANTYLPKPGPASLATAGTGDVLAGMIGAFIASRDQQTSADEERHQTYPQELGMVAALASLTHGIAAEMAQDKHGSAGVIASDVIAELGLALDEATSAILEATNTSGVDA